VFAVEIINHGSRWGDTAQGLAQWWHTVASREALDVLNWAMHLALYCRTRMVIESASKVGLFFVLSVFWFSTTYYKDHGMVHIN
jgi:hypothetical protein